MKVSNQHSLLERIVRAAEIDTVIDTRLVVNSLMAPPRLAHENNVIGTMNILAACTGSGLAGPEGSSSRAPTHYYGAEQDDPAFFTEEMGRPHPPRTGLERDIVEAEAGGAASSRSETRRSTTTILRCANVLGPDVDTAFTRMLRLPMVPMVLGFDPRLQFVHEDDVVHALEHAAFHLTPGIYNVAADGVLALSEIIDLVGKIAAPVLPPWGTGVATSSLRRLGFRIPVEMRQPAAVRPRRRQPALQGDRVRLRIHDPRGRDQACPSTCAWPRSCAAPSRSTRTSARSRSSCAGARTCGASIRASGAAWPPTASRSGSDAGRIADASLLATSVSSRPALTGPLH